MEATRERGEKKKKRSKKKEVSVAEVESEAAEAEVKGDSVEVVNESVVVQSSSQVEVSEESAIDFKPENEVVNEEIPIEIEPEPIEILLETLNIEKDNLSNEIKVEVESENSKTKGLSLNKLTDETPVVNDNLDFDPCEEASEVLHVPTAPSTSNLESGDFYSVQSIQSKTTLSLGGIEQEKEGQTLYPHYMLKDISESTEVEVSVLEELPISKTIGQQEVLSILVEPMNSIQLKNLYSNYLIENVVDDIEQFCDTHIQPSYEGCELYELLLNYSRACNQLASCEKSLDSLKLQCEEYEKDIWTLSSKVLTKSAQCLDKNSITITHRIHIANFSQKIYSQLTKGLCEVKDLIKDSFSLYVYSIQLSKSQIEHFFYKSFSHINIQCGDVQGYISEYPNQEYYNSANLLRTCISILFSFLRKPCTLIQPDFVKDCQDWIKKSASLLLRMAHLNDHYFLLNHILRCPPGSISKWASSLVQIPAIPIPENFLQYSGTFGHVNLDYSLSILFIILRPVLKREEFLTRTYKSIVENVSKNESKNQWVVIDSDGEDEPEDLSFFKESDLISLLQQIPFEEIFQRILFILKIDGQSLYDINFNNNHSILKLLAFSTQLVNLLGSGFSTYYTDRYRRLVKIIGRLILHISQYLTEHIENYLSLSHSEESKIMLNQIQVEYDSFLMKLCSTLIEGKNIGTLQFLASVPFHLISIENLWKIYAYLTKWYKSSSGEHYEDISLELEHELMNMSESDALYLLTVMSNMAIARENIDTNFHKTVIIHLFQVGFISKITKDKYFKTSKDLLGSMSSHFPYLISTLIHNIKQKMDVLEKMSIFLLKELSFENWRPSNVDFLLLSHWLLDFNPYTLENQVSRFILHSINWDFDKNNQLFLSQKHHHKIALLVLEASIKWDKSQNILSESVKQVSEIATRSNDMNFSSWTWDIILRLHLHGFDKFNGDEFSFTKILRNLPTFESHSEMEHLRKSLDDKNPLGAYIALLVLPLGHSMPLICSFGFENLEILIQSSKFESVIHILFYIIPIFAGSKDELIKNERFQNIMVNLLAADKTYMAIAKNLLVDEPGVMTKLFGEMIQSQLHNVNRFNTSERNIVRLWTESFTSLDNWNKDFNILYLLDILAQFSFCNPDCNEYFITHFTSLYAELPTSNSSGIASYLFNWSTPSTTFLLNLSYPKVPYFAYFIYKIEMQLEDHKGFWKSLVKDCLPNPKLSLDASVKKAKNVSKLSTSTNYLSIYRFASQALELPVDHPLTLLFWQKFFLRYFHKIDGSCGNERFFEGLINYNFYKKLIARINESLEFYRLKLVSFENEANESARKNIGENTQWLISQIQNKIKILQMYSLWISESRLHSPTLYLTSLPAQYSPNRLLTLIEGDMTEWSDLFEIEEIEAIQKEYSKSYLTFIKREIWFEGPKRCKSHRMLNNDNNTSEYRTSEILNRFSSYDKPLSPPRLPNFVQVIPLPNLTMFNDLQLMTEGIRPHMRALTEFSENFSLQIAHHTALNCTYLEFLPNLYENEDMEQLKTSHCSGGKNFVVQGCLGPARVIFKFKEAKLKERIGHLIQQNRTEYSILINSNSICSPPTNFISSCIYLEDLITNLIICYRHSTIGSQEINKIQMVGIELFYIFSGLVKEASLFYPPTRQLFSSFIEILGKEFISDDSTQCLRLIDGCKNTPNLIGDLAPHINLAKANVSNLINIYSKIISISKNQPDLAFVILSKLVLSSWLKLNRPNLKQSSQLISHIWKGITAEGMVPEKSNTMVFDIYRYHLRTMLLYEFPQHFGEILNLLLEGSDKQSVSVDVWYDFFNTLCQDKKFLFHQNMDPYTRKKEAKRFATEVDVLHSSLLFSTAKLLYNYFTKERLSYGIYGLYPKYRAYIEPFSCLIQMITYSLITFSLKSSNGVLSQKILESVWPVLRDVYAPWILPYNQKIINEQCAQWIQRINFDNTSVLQPWIPNDSSIAMIFMNDFTDCILFLAETLPGSPLWNYIWHYYCDNFAQMYVKEHILSVVHSCLITVSWSTFWPTFQDVELMNSVVEKFLPPCQSFLSVIYAQINWGEWTRQLLSGSFSQSSRGHSILLNLTIRLSHDSVARESPTWISVMEFSEFLNWEYVQLNFLENIMSWYIMTVDPVVVLQFDTTHPLDIMSLRMLKIACCYLRPEDSIPKTQIKFQPDKVDTNKKRYLFIRSYVRLIVTASSKYKNLLESNGKNFECGIKEMIGDLVKVVKIEKLKIEEFLPHLKELVSLMSNHILGIIGRNAFIVWCEEHNDVIPLCFLYAIIQLSFTSKVLPYITIPLIETCIRLSFKHKDASWNSMTEFISCLDNSEMNQYFDTSSKDGQYLVLYGLLHKRFDHLGTGGLSTVTFLTDLMKNIKPKETNESVLPLIYSLIMRLSVHLLLESEKIPGDNLERSVKKFLNTLALHLSLLGDEKESWGSIFGALGLGRGSQLSINGRLFAKILSIYLMAQIPLNKPVRILSDTEGHFTLDEPIIKQHCDLKTGLEKLEGLKLIRGYVEHTEIIDASIELIKDPQLSLSSCDILINKLVCSLFSESFLN